jgi:hypothetical protein
MRMTFTVYTAILLLWGPFYPLMAQAPEMGRAEQLVRSGDWQIRERGLTLLLSIRKEFPDVGDELLFELLNRENDWVYLPRAEGDYIPEGFGDPYYSTLLGECMKIYRKEPLAERFVSLANGSYNGDSPFAIELGQDAVKHLNFIERLSKSPNQQIRLNAASLLVHALAGGMVAAQDRSMVLEILSGRLTDPSSEVRVPLASMLSRLVGGEDVHQALRAARDRLLQMEPRPTANELQRMEESIRRSSGTEKP